eukprot:Gb_36666 [translate_table: standard]
MPSGPVRYVPGSHTPGERDECIDSSIKYADGFLEDELHGERRLREKVLDSGLIQADGILQYNLSCERRMLPESVRSSKNVASQANINQGRRNSESNLEFPNLSTEIEGQCNGKDAKQIRSFEMREHGSINKKKPHIHQESSITSHFAESNHTIPFSGKLSTHPYGLRVYDGIKHVPDGLSSTSLPFEESNPTQETEAFGDETNILLVASLSGRREKIKVEVKNKAIQALAARAACLCAEEASLEGV